MVDGVAMIISLHNQNGRGEITFLGKDIISLIQHLSTFGKLVFLRKVGSSIYDVS